MITLQTARLLCTPLSQDDWPLFLSLQQNDAVMHYVADPRGDDEIRAAFDARLPTWSPGADHWLCLVVRERQSGRALGVTGYIERESGCGEVGFLFSPEAQGRGYASESLRAVCDFAFRTGALRRLTATVTAGNTASRRVLEKTGFQLEGELRESYFLRGEWRNDWLFGLLYREHTFK